MIILIVVIVMAYAFSRMTGVSLLVTVPIAVVLGIVALVIAAKEEDKQKKQAEQQVEQQAEQKKQDYAEFIKLVTEYVQTPDHSAQEVKEAWEKYNNLLQLYGVKKDGPVFKIYHDVYAFLEQQIPGGLSAENKETWIVFYRTLAANLWEFYYRIAFAYDLTSDKQEALLQYLAQCFSGGEEYNDFAHAQHWSYGNFDWNTWNDKYLALWKKGVECASAFAICRLADCYYKLIIVDLKDFDKAFSLYQQAARLGDMQAVYMLGCCYENARGTRRDYQKAGDCYMYAYSNTKNQDYSAAVGRLYDGNRWDKNKYSPDIFDCSNTPVMKKTNLAKLKLDMEKCLHTDLNTADLSILAVSIGMISETIIKSFIECYESAYQKADPSEQIELLRNRGYFTKEMFYQTTTVRKLRNRGAHNRDGEPVTLEEIKQALHYIREIVDYYEQF